LNSECGEDIGFQVISTTENSNKFQKTRFWKEKSVEHVITLECPPFNSSKRNCDVLLLLLESSWQFKFNEIYGVRFGLRMWEIWNSLWFLSLKFQIICKTLHYNKFTLGPMAQTTLVIIYIIKKLWCMSL
jgi:hypothetical protein